jgi:hypothetical protein
MPSRGVTERRSVFLNVPFDKSYESIFVALTSSVVALGRTPRCVLELPEVGEGRLARILRLIRSCPVSIHALSRVGLPARFNMPFELGIAFTLARIERNHDFIILESVRHRLQRTLSDANGIDPGIHGATITGAVSCVLSQLGKPRGNPLPNQVVGVYRQLRRTIPFVKRNHGRSNIYSRAIFGELVEGAATLARKDGLIAA